MTNYDLLWKGRFIITMDGQVDLPPDRQSVEGGNTDPTGAARERIEFLDALSDAMQPSVLFQVIRSKILAREIDTRKAADVVLLDATHDGEHWLIKGNTNGSAGYFYVEARRVPLTPQPERELYLKVAYRGDKDDDDALLELAEAVAEHAQVSRVRGYRSDSQIAFTGLSAPVDISGSVAERQ